MTKKIQAKCFVCGTVGYIPEDYQGKIKCPRCKSSFRRTGNPCSVVRRQLLERLHDIEQAGITKVRWLGGDRHSCAKCRNRNVKVYTIQEMAEILHSEFCDADPFEQGCRCTIGAHKE